MVPPVLTAQAERARLAAKLLFTALLAVSPRALAQDEEGEQAAEPSAEEKAEESPAAAKEQKKPAEATTAEPESEKQFGHGGQAGLRLALNGGYRMIFRFDKSPLCAKYDETKEPRKQQKFCGHVAPFALDLGLSYAPFDSVEPYLWARFGLTGEDETHTDPVVILGAGVRIYTMSESAFKIFIEPAFGMELEGGDDPIARAHGLDLEYKTDVLFHAAAGAQVDVSENFGFFLDAGLTTGILRAIHSTLEVNLGIQGRI
jgi:hypothetical protein